MPIIQNIVCANTLQQAPHLYQIFIPAEQQTHTLNYTNTFFAALGPNADVTLTG